MQAAQNAVITSATTVATQTAATIAKAARSTNKQKKPKITLISLTFDACLEQIDVARQRSDAEYYKLLLAVLTAHQVGFGDSVSEEQLETNDKTLNELCNKRKIVGSGRVSKLCKLAITDDSKRVYPIVYVIDVAIALIRKKQLSLSKFVSWINDKHGLQNIRLIYNRDGSVKSNGTSTQKLTAEQIKANIEKAKEHLGTKELLKLPASAISPFAAHGETADCAAIISQLADGSFVIREIVSDAYVVRSALAVIGRNLP